MIKDIEKMLEEENLIYSRYTDISTIDPPHPFSRHFSGVYIFHTKLIRNGCGAVL